MLAGLLRVVQARTMVVGLLVMACAVAPTLAPGEGFVAGAADACLPACVELTGPAETAFTWAVAGLGVVGTGTLDAQGRAAVCLEAPLAPGLHTLDVTLGEEQTVRLDFEVRPFGHAWGLERPLDPLASLPWTPTPTGREAPPLLSPRAGAWDARVVSAPARLVHGDEELLFYAGKASDEAAYGLGVARRPVAGGPFVAGEGPILSAEEVGAGEGDWDVWAQNTPYAVPSPESAGLWLYYNGRDLEDTSGTLSIGLATSADGLSWSSERVPVLPGGPDPRVFEHSGLAHPTLVHHADEGVWALWWASGTLEIGHALSTDGRTWTKYCGGSVFQGTGTWDLGWVKAPDVVYADGLYWMAFAGCDKGCFEIGWAASADGTRWVAAEAPILGEQEGTWDGESPQGPHLERDGEGGWWMWYSAQDPEGYTHIGRVGLR